MKLRTWITLLFISIALSTVTAQKAKHFEVGVQGGYGNHWIINQNNYGLREMDYEFYWGGGYNFQVGYNFNENLGLFAEIGAQNQGQKYSDTWDNNEIERTVDLKYMTIPVFFKYSAGNTKAHFRLLVGPQFSFLNKAEQEYLRNGQPFSFPLTNKKGEAFDVGSKDITDRFTSMDIASVIDLGADIFLLEDMLYLSVGARIYYGLTDINADDYQMENIDGNYEPSHTAGGSIYGGIHYIIMGGK